MQTGPLKSLYLTAMNVEQENLLQQDVFEWVSAPKGKSAGHLTRSRAVFEIKWDQMTGHMDKAKCRIVAQGFTQRYGVDFTETYATTPKLSTMRLFMKKALQLKMRRCGPGCPAAVSTTVRDAPFRTPCKRFKSSRGSVRQWRKPCATAVQCIVLA